MQRPLSFALLLSLLAACGEAERPNTNTNDVAGGESASSTAPARW